jgi:hypothetical protein
MLNKTVVYGIIFFTTGLNSEARAEFGQAAKKLPHNRRYSPLPSQKAGGLELIHRATSTPYQGERLT